MTIVLRRLLLGDLDLTDYPLSVEFGGDLGSPENVYDVLVSLLSDGEISTSDRVGNRTITFSVLVEGATLAELAQNEAALIAECDKARNTLTIDPGDDYAAASVFDVFRVQATLQYDDNLEQSNFRRYQLTIPAWPYARGADLVVTPALAVTPTYTLVDNGSALSGGGFSWAVNGLGATTVGDYSVASVSGRIRLYAAPPHSSFDQTFYRSGTVSLTLGRYVPVDMAFSNLVPSSILMYNGAAPIVATQDLGSGVTRYFFDGAGLGGSLPTPLRVRVIGSIPASGTAAYAEIDQVQLADTIPFIGTARQRATSLVPGGSVRTHGSMRIAHPSNPLGKVIAYTHPSGTGYLPPLRQWRTSGNTVTTDTSLNSGAREPIGPSSTVFRVPQPVLPAGRVEVWAWLRVTSGSLTRAPAYAIRSIVNGVTLASSGGNFSTVFTALNTWQLFCLGALTSPPIGMGPSGLVQIDLNENSGQVEIDEAYLFATDHGSLTVVDCGTGTASAGGPSRNLWIDAPSLEQPMGAVYRGHSDDRSDSWHVGGPSDVWGIHNFDPAGTSVFVVTSGTTDANTSLEHYRRYHTHVAE
jgi:hypothetical protein